MKIIVLDHAFNTDHIVYIGPLKIGDTGHIKHSFEIKLIHNESILVELPIKLHYMIGSPPGEVIKGQSHMVFNKEELLNNKMYIASIKCITAFRDSVMAKWKLSYSNETAIPNLKFEKYEE